MRREVEAAKQTASQCDFDQELSNAIRRNKKCHGANELRVPSPYNLEMGEDPKSAKHDSSGDQAKPNQARSRNETLS
jgi:hypothetical protein